MNNSDFLDYLKNEFHQYHQIPTQETQARNEKKQFIAGLMKASRFFGVSYEALQGIVEEEQRKGAPPFASLDDKLIVPTYIRQQAKPDDNRTEQHPLHP